MPDQLWAMRIPFPLSNAATYRRYPVAKAPTHPASSRVGGESSVLYSMNATFDGASPRRYFSAFSDSSLGPLSRLYFTVRT
jgi:hypothetical protein